jgi:hypothetical protein
MHVYLMTIVGVRFGNLTIISNTFVEFTIFVKVWFEELVCLGAVGDYRGIKAFPIFFSNFLPAQRAGKKLGREEMDIRLTPGS